MILVICMYVCMYKYFLFLLVFSAAAAAAAAWCWAEVVSAHWTRGASLKPFQQQTRLEFMFTVTNFRDFFAVDYDFMWDVADDFVHVGRERIQVYVCRNLLRSHWNVDRSVRCEGGRIGGCVVQRRCRRRSKVTNDDEIVACVCRCGVGVRVRHRCRICLSLRRRWTLCCCCCCRRRIHRTIVALCSNEVVLFKHVNQVVLILVIMVLILTLNMVYITTQ